MEDHVRIEAARLDIESKILLKLVSQKCSIESTKHTDIHFLEILRESNRVYNYARIFSAEANRIYHDDIERRIGTAGRMVDIAMPVRLSGAITEIASLMDQAENELSKLGQNIDELESKATFGVDSNYEELARIALALDAKMIDRVLLFLQAFLWMAWTLESLSQADQVFGLMRRENRFSDVGENAFAYVAHPPIAVSTLTCTAMIEEVGAVYINQFVPGSSYSRDDTRVSDILNDLSREFEDHPDFDIQEIQDTIVPSRVDISHYLSKRATAVTEENFEEYVKQAQACIRLVGTLTLELMSDVLRDYEERVLQNIVMTITGT